jgi:hypothetical protein
LDNKPRLKKVRNKKRRVDLGKAEIQAKVKKFKKLATQSRVAYRMVDSSRNIIQNITQNPQTPISSNERAVRALVNSFCDFQIDRGKMTKLEKKTTLKKYDVKIADLKAYEVIYKFFLEVLKEAQAGKLGDGIKQELGDKYDGLESKVQIYLQSVLDMVTGATKNPSLTTIAKIPVDIFHQIDVATAIIRAEQKAFKRFRGRIANLSGFIPQATQDPVLIYIRSKINKASSIVLLLIDGIAKFVKKIVEFISGLMKPITDFIKKTLSEETEKIKAKEIERQKALIESRTNLDGRVMAAMFGLAGRLLWTGATWTNPAGTRFVVANVGRFSPVMKALNQNGSQGYGEELAKGFNNQLQKMAGLAIPLPSTGIVPFSWKGYVPIQGTFPTTL